MKKTITITLVAAFLFAGVVSAESGHDDKKKGKHFASLDKNKDGSISKDEWMAKFKTIDADNNGKITKEEMKKHHHQMMKAHH